MNSLHQSKDDKKKKNFLFILTGLISLTTILLVGILEYVASLNIYKDTWMIIDHPRLNHAWRPNYNTLCTFLPEVRDKYGTHYLREYNKQGWIEFYDIVKQKPKNTYRIFYVGDSFTEAPLAMDMSVPSIVEKGLNKNFDNQEINFEVINAGVSSYSPLLYYILTRYYIMPYDPDLIVINVDMTDFYDDLKYRATLITDENGDPWAVPPRNIYVDVLDAEGGDGQINFTHQNSFISLQAL